MIHRRSAKAYAIHDTVYHKFSSQFSNNGLFVASCSRDGSVCVNRVEQSGKDQRNLQSTQSLWHAAKVCWSPNDLWLIVSVIGNHDEGGLDRLEVFAVDDNGSLSLQTTWDAWPYCFEAPWISNECFVYAGETIYYPPENIINPRMLQTIYMVDVNLGLETKLLNLKCHHNYDSSCAEALLLPSVGSTSQSSSADFRRSHLAVISSYNELICHMIYFVPLDRFHDVVFSMELADEDVIDVNDLAFIDVAGGILDMSVCRSQTVHLHLFVTVRPFVHATHYLNYRSVCPRALSRSAEGAADPYSSPPDIQPFFEIHVYDTRSFQILHKLTGLQLASPTSGEQTLPNPIHLSFLFLTKKINKLTLFICYSSFICRRSISSL